MIQFVDSLIQFSATKGSCGGKLLGIIPHWYENLQDQNCEVNIDLSNHPEALWQIGFNLVEILLRVGGLVALGYLIYGGFLFMTSQGEPEGMKKARSTIVNALIGVVISVAASSIVIYIAGKF